MRLYTNPITSELAWLSGNFNISNPHLNVIHIGNGIYHVPNNKSDKFSKFRNFLKSIFPVKR